MGIPPEMLEQMMISAEEYGDRQRLKRERGLPSSVLAIGRRDPNTGLYSATSAGRGELQGRKLSNTDYRAGESVPWYSKDGRVAIDGNDWSNQPFIPQDEDEPTFSPFAMLYREIVNPNTLEFRFWLKSPDFDLAVLLDRFFGSPNNSAVFFVSIVAVNRVTYAVQSELYTASNNQSSIKTWLVQNNIVIARASNFNYSGILAQYSQYLRQEPTVIAPGVSNPSDMDNVDAFQVFNKNRADAPVSPSVSGGFGVNDTLTVLNDKGYVAILAVKKPLDQVEFRSEITLLNQSLLEQFQTIELTQDVEIQVIEIADVDQYRLLTGESTGSLEFQFQQFKLNPNNKIIPEVIKYENNRFREVPGFAGTEGDLRLVIPRVIPPTLV